MKFIHTKHDGDNVYETIYGVVFIKCDKNKNYYIDLDSHNTSRVRWEGLNYNSFDTIEDAENFLMEREIKTYNNLLETFKLCEIKETIVMSKI